MSRSTKFSILTTTVFGSAEFLSKKPRQENDGLHIFSGAQMAEALAAGPALLHVHGASEDELKFQVLRYTALKSLSFTEYLVLFGYKREWIQDREFLLAQLVLPVDIKTPFLESLPQWRDLGLLSLGALENLIVQLSMLFQKLEIDAYKNLRRSCEAWEPFANADELKLRISAFFARPFVKLFIWSYRKRDRGQLIDLPPQALVELLLYEYEARGLRSSHLLQLFLFGEIVQLGELAGEACQRTFSLASRSTARVKFHLIGKPKLHQAGDRSENFGFKV